MTGKHMQIGEVAARTELSLRTIRHYEETGLVVPSARSQGGFRLYTEGDVARILLIRRMKPLGFTLDEMRELLDVVDAMAGDADDPSVRARLDAVRAEAAARREKLRRQVEMADEFLDQLERI